MQSTLGSIDKRHGLFSEIRSKWSYGFWKIPDVKLEIVFFWTSTTLHKPLISLLWCKGTGIRLDEFIINILKILLWFSINFERNPETCIFWEWRGALWHLTKGKYGFCTQNIVCTICAKCLWNCWSMHRKCTLRLVIADAYFNYQSILKVWYMYIYTSVVTIVEYLSGAGEIQ